MSIKVGNRIADPGGRVENNRESGSGGCCHHNECTEDMALEMLSGARRQGGYMEHLYVMLKLAEAASGDAVAAGAEALSLMHTERLHQCEKKVPRSALHRVNGHIRFTHCYPHSP